MRKPNRLMRLVVRVAPTKALLVALNILLGIVLWLLLPTIIREIRVAAKGGGFKSTR